MVPRLFISYRRTQLGLVRPAVEALRAAGVDCFFDLDDIDPLADFPERVRQGIAESHALLAWWSRDYGESDHCLAEFKLAWQHARRRSSDVGRRVWVLNPEPHAAHVLGGELNAKNFLQPPTPGTEARWAQNLHASLQPLLPEGPLADERKVAPAPRLVNVPPSTHEFTGRKAEMLRIHGALHPPQIGSAGLAAAVQVHGLGGIGKTALAATYAHDFAHAYPGGVVWLNLAGYEPGQPARRADGENAWYKAVEATFRGEPDLLYDAQGKARPAPQVHRLLEQRFPGPEPYLWVLDSVPVLIPESERDSILAFWRAPTPVGRTLVTTRDSRPAAGFAAQQLDVLGEGDALRLLTRYRRSSPAERSMVLELVHTVGAHALALTLLGEQLRDADYARVSARLKETGLLEQIETIADDLSEELGDKARGILATFAVSLEPLDEQARLVLALAAGCAPNEPIPVGLLADAFASVDGEGAGRRWLKRLPFFGAPAKEVDRFVPALRQLQRGSLLTRRQGDGSDDDSVMIHPLVAAAALRLLGVDPADVAECVAAALVARTEGVAAEVLGHPRLAADIAQARYLSTTLESESTVWLAISVGRFEHARGAFPLARIAEERALEIGRRLGEDHPATIIALNNLAGTLQAEGDLVAARALQEDALTVVRKYLGEDDQMTLSFIDNLGTMLHGLGQLAEARALHERTLEVRRRVLGHDHQQTLLSMNNLANVLGSQGDLVGARALTERALELSRRTLGEEHPDALRLMGNLAQLQHMQGDWAGARVLTERTLEHYRRLFGDEHPDTLKQMNNLAQTLLSQGDLAGARALNERALELYRHLLGDEHPDTLRAMSNLVEGLRAEGDLAGARTLSERTLELYRRRLGDEHPDTLRTMGNLALVLQAEGDLAGARALQQRVLDVLSRVLGPEHPQTLTAVNNLAVTLSNQGDLSTARALDESAFALARGRLGEEHPLTLMSAWNLFKTLEGLQDHDAMRTLLTTSALSRLPTLPDASLPMDLRNKKQEIASACQALGVPTSRPGA